MKLSLINCQVPFFIGLFACWLTNSMHPTSSMVNFQCSLNSADQAHLKLLTCINPEQESCSTPIFSNESTTVECIAGCNRQQTVPLHANFYDIVREASAVIQGQTTLHSAVMGGDLQICKIIIAQACCDLNVQDDTGQTPLHKAVIMGHRDIVEFLLASGAKTSTDNSGKIPLYYAKMLYDRTNFQIAVMDRVDYAQSMEIVKFKKIIETIVLYEALQDIVDESNKK